MTFKHKINAILRDDDNARTAFNKEFDAIIANEKKKTSNKCFFSFLSGSLMSTAIFTLFFLQINGRLF